MTRAWWQFGRREDELSEEIESHIAMAIAERVARGESLASATAAVRREFGNREIVRATARDMWGWIWLEQLWLDLRYALRKLRQAPGFTAVAILSLAIGIGATVTMYAVVDAADLRALPYPHADRLFVIEQTITRARPGGPNVANAGPAGAATTSVWLQSSHAFDAMVRVGRTQLEWPRGDESEPLALAMVGSGFFPMLGATPMIGRGIAPSDTTPDAPRVIVLSQAFWHDRFSADRHVIGQQVQLDTSNVPSAPPETFTVIGVMPEQVDYPPAVNGWIAERPGWNSYATVLARLGRGKTIEAAVAELSAVTRALPPPQGLTRPSGVRATGLRESLRMSGPMDMFSIGSAEGRVVRLAIVSFVLVIAMFNVGNLLLARSAARDHEMAVRRALGASHARLAQQLLVEGACIAVIGGALGTAVARWGIAMSGAFGSLSARAIVPELDWRVLAFALALTTVVALGTGFIPVLALGRMGSGSKGNESPRASASRTRTRVQGGLLIVQVGAALTLLTGAGILGKELLRLEKQGLGIDATNITWFGAIRRPEASSMSRAQFRDEVLLRLGRIPGVSSVSAYEISGNEGFYPVGDSTKGGYTIFDHQNVAVDSGFRKNLGIPLVRGRDFTEADYVDAAPVALISRAAAESFWPGQEPLGKQVIIPPPSWIWTGDTSKVAPLTVTVVGVVGDFRLARVFGPPPNTLLRPNGTKAGIAVSYYVRTAKDPAQTLPTIRSAVRALQHIPLSRMMFGNMQEIAINRQLAEQRMTTRALMAFAAVALLLATLGIHGLVAYSVAQRTREIGIRMALGAESGSVLLLVTRRGLSLAAGGIVLGVGGAFALSQAIKAMLYGTSPTDPAVFAGSALVLAVVIFIASYLPARRATRVDPMIALRVD